MGIRTRETGDLGEEIAAKFLDSRGFKVIERNYQKPWGEVDIICEKDSVVRFVEVKSVSVKDFSRERSYEPEDLVDARKLRKVSRTATLYMDSKRDMREFQIDVVAVLLNHEKKIARCTFLEQVLEHDL
jgi:putative endonuclease